jgi:protein arginine kinase activator
MNRCQFCGAVATIHLTDIQAGVRRETHLCDPCGRERELIPDGGTTGLNLPALLHLVYDGAVEPEAESDTCLAVAPLPVPSPPAVLKCPECGLKYAQFRTDGRLGCPEDYDVFREVLLPLLEKIHMNVDHAGKVPRAVQRTHLRQELEERLDAAVAAEDYEDAARLRDALKKGVPSA